MVITDTPKERNFMQRIKMVRAKAWAAAAIAAAAATRRNDNNKNDKINQQHNLNTKNYVHN